ncbi:hypothetical protein OAF16_01130 [Flavobacteriales bacterium]|nr:hypothetical protein [Flavobacteriales bacterium]
MINKLDKKVSNKIKERLSKFIDFKYESYVLGVKNKSFLKTYEDEILKTSKHFRGYCKNEFEAMCLGVFTLELAHLKRTESWEITLNNKTKPLLNDGANNLLKAIEAFNVNPNNIEQITIKTKHPDNFLESTTVNTDKITKDPSGPYLNISGLIAINRVMNGVSNKQAIKELQTISKANKPEKKDPINFFKESAKTLYPYLKKYFNHLPSENERYFLGAQLLDTVEIKPNYRNLAKLEQDEIAYKRAMINNFKKAVL